MNLDHLQLFRDVAHSRSISRGAALNGVSQSAASQHLQELERIFEVKLVDRSKRPLNLTGAGRLYYEFCKDVLRRRKEFEVALEQMKGRAESAVRVASIYSVGLVEMSRLEEEFAARHPEAELAVDYLRPEKVYEAVLSERADIGLVSYPEPSKELQVIPWREEKMVLATAASHRLGDRHSIRIEELKGEDFIGFDEDLPISKEVSRFLKESGVEVELIMHFDNIQMMKEAVALGSGISILPDRILAPDVSSGRIHIVELETPGLTRPLGIVHLRRKKFNRATQSFLELLLEIPAEETAA